MGLEGHLEGDVARGAAHEPDKVIVLVGRGGVDHQVADHFRIHPAGRVEAEARRNLCILQVAIDGLGDADDFGGQPLAAEELGEHGGIGVGVVSADDHQAVEAQFLHRLGCHLELLGRFDLVAA
eukprot:scaffold368029_cov37-Prasinocladus_malaysianus.AAC.1